MIINKIRDDTSFTKACGILITTRSKVEKKSSTTNTKIIIVMSNSRITDNVNCNTSHLPELDVFIFFQ